MTTIHARKFTRREMLGTTAAATLVASAGALPAIAATSKFQPGEGTVSHDCAAQHKALSDNLVRLANTGPVQGPYGLDYALKTTVCPHCSTRIGLDPALV